MKVQFVRRTNIYPIPPPTIISPPGPGKLHLIHKRYKFKPLRPPGARQPDAEARVAMRIAAMVDGRYCCGDVIGR